MPHLAELTSAADFERPGAACCRNRSQELELLLRRDLDLIRYPARPWVLPREAPDGAHGARCARSSAADRPASRRRSA